MSQGTCPPDSRNALKEDELALEEAGMQGHIAKPLDLHKMMD